MIHEVHYVEGQPHLALRLQNGQWGEPARPGGAPHKRFLDEQGIVHEFYLGQKAPSGELFPWFGLPQPNHGTRFLPRLQGRRWICAITGCKEKSAKFTPQVQAAAQQAGQLAARYGWTVLTGGLSGVMSAAAEGAQSLGGETLGILPGEEHHQANPHIDFVIPSGIGYARNYLVAVGCDLMISLPGGTGTLEEMCFALDFQRAVISWGGWEVEHVKQIALADLAAVEAQLIEIMKNKYTNIPGGINEKQ